MDERDAGSEAARRQIVAVHAAKHREQDNARPAF
jgi:hypothetical protein